MKPLPNNSDNYIYIYELKMDLYRCEVIFPKIPADIFGNISRFRIGFTSDMMEINNLIPIEFRCDMELLFFAKIDSKYVKKQLIKNIKEKFQLYTIIKYNSLFGYNSTEIFFTNPEIVTFIINEFKKQIKLPEIT